MTHILILLIGILLLSFIRLELFFGNKGVLRPIGINEDHEISFAGDHLQVLINSVTPVFKIFAQLVNISIQLFQVILHKVYRSIVAFLNASQDGLVGSVENVNRQV